MRLDRQPGSRRSGTLAVLALLVGSVLVQGEARAAPLSQRDARATITISGRVGCSAGPFVGLWVVSTGGGAGWAHWTKTGPAEQVVNAASSYSRTFTTSLPTTVTLHIGCTGSPHKWGMPLSTESVTVNASASLNTWCSVGNGSCTAFSPPPATWPADWAGPSFCGTHPGPSGAPFTGNVLAGVATCGTGWEGPNGNYQGGITYNGVTFDSLGYQCVEYASRYFYFVTGNSAPTPGAGWASNWAWTTSQKFRQYGVSAGGGSGGSNTFASTIVPGDIISMWDEASNQGKIGHVGVVQSVAMSAGNGTITIADENAAPNGQDVVNVRGGLMTSGSYTQFQWIYGLPDPRL